MTTRRQQKRSTTGTQNQQAPRPKSGNQPPRQVNSPVSSQQKGAKIEKVEHLSEDQVNNLLNPLDISIKPTAFAALADALNDNTNIKTQLHIHSSTNHNIMDVDQ